MAVIVLLSTMSFTVNRHYCGHILVDKAIYKEAKSCGMEIMQKAPIKGCSVDSPSCCDDEHQLVQGQNELKVEKFNLKNQQLHFITLLAFTYLELLLPQEVVNTTFIGYSPPPLVKSIFKIDESFLI